VGGWVRDQFIGRPSKDVDFAVEASSYKEMKDWLESNDYEIKCEEPQYFRIKARPPEGHKYRKYVCDYLLTRSDGLYTDGRRPDSVEISDIFTDLSRRDFSINSIAINVDTNEVIDPYNGRKDIENKILRPVGDVAERMEEDPLRIIRAIRFISQLGFKPSYNLRLYLKSSQAAQQIKRVEMERVRQELERAFRYDTSKTLETLYSNCHRGISTYIFSTGLWLLPTTKDR
jgi:tRNA nucleotidyltransferase/poly(A) polymerase